MHVWQLRSDANNCRWLTLTNESEFSLLSKLNDSSAGDRWVPLTAEWLEDDLNTGKPKCDFPTLGSTPTFSQHAVDSLLDLLVENGELLPLSVAGGRYFVFNTTRTIDALNESRSILTRFSSGRIMAITQYDFHAQRLEGSTIFRLPQVRGAVYVTDGFVKRVNDTGLSGFDFEPIWSAE